MWRVRKSTTDINSVVHISYNLYRLLAMRNAYTTLRSHVQYKMSFSVRFTSISKLSSRHTCKTVFRAAFACVVLSSASMQRRSVVCECDQTPSITPRLAALFLTRFPLWIRQQSSSQWSVEWRRRTRLAGHATVPLLARQCQQRQLYGLQMPVASNIYCGDFVTFIIITIPPEGRKLSFFPASLKAEIHRLVHVLC